MLKYSLSGFRNTKGLCCRIEIDTPSERKHPNDKNNKVRRSNKMIKLEEGEGHSALWSYYYGNLGFVTHSGVTVKLPSNKD